MPNGIIQKETRGCVVGTVFCQQKCWKTIDNVGEWVYNRSIKGEIEHHKRKEVKVMPRIETLKSLEMRLNIRPHECERNNRLKSKNGYSLVAVSKDNVYTTLYPNKQQQRDIENNGLGYKCYMVRG